MKEDGGHGTLQLCVCVRLDVYVADWSAGGGTQFKSVGAENLPSLLCRFVFPSLVCRARRKAVAICAISQFTGS